MDALEALENAYSIYKNLFILDLKNFTYEEAIKINRKANYSHLNLADYLFLFNRKDVFWPLIWRIYSLEKYASFSKNEVNLQFKIDGLKHRRLLLHYLLAYWTKYSFVKGKNDSFTTRVAILIKKINKAQENAKNTFLPIKEWSSKLAEIFHSPNISSFAKNISENAMSSINEHKLLCQIFENFTPNNQAASDGLSKMILEFENARLLRFNKIFSYQLEHIVPKNKDKGKFWSQWINRNEKIYRKYKPGLNENDAEIYENISHMLGNGLLIKGEVNNFIKQKDVTAKIKAIDESIKIERIDLRLFYLNDKYIEDTMDIEDLKQLTLNDIPFSLVNHNPLNISLEWNDKLNRYDFRKILLRSKLIAEYLDINILKVNFLNTLT